MYGSPVPNVSGLLWRVTSAVLFSTLLVLLISFSIAYER